MLLNISHWKNIIPAIGLKLGKFCVVGASGMVVDFGITLLCKEILHLNKYLANSLGFILAATSNYFLNRWWTFQSTSPQVVKEYSIFFILSLIGLGINNLVIFILHGKWKFNFYLSKIFAIGMVTFWNFFMNYFFNFQ
ncbi:MAG: GtrA family protein [Bacteroidales bacterium]|jgi:putative flippase GtrA|nr:GtrA family protein [Bacteroidales bacterium]